MSKNYFDRNKWYWLVPKIRDIQEAKPDLPITLRIDLTPDCNFDCYFCLYMSKKSPILNDDGYQYPAATSLHHEKLVKIIDLFTARGLKTVILTGGGEPFVYDRFGEILDRLFQNKIEVGIITNGTGINEEFINKYCSNPYLKWIRVSLNTSDSDTWKKLHRPKVEFTFQQVCDGISQLVRVPERGYMVAINFLVTPTNYKEIITAFELAKRLGVDNIRYTPVFTKVGKKIYEKTQEEIDIQLDYVISKKKPLVRVNRQRFTFMDIPNQTDKCWFSHFSVNMGVDSQLYPCCLKKYVNGMGTPLTPETFEQDLQSYFEKMGSFDAKSCMDCMYHQFNYFAEDLSENGRLDNFIP